MSTRSTLLRALRPLRVLRDRRVAAVAAVIATAVGGTAMSEHAAGGTAPAAAVTHASAHGAAALHSAAAHGASAAPRRATATAVAPRSLTPAAQHLAAQVASALHGSTAATLGAYVDVSGYGLLYSHSGSTPLLPASSEKTLTMLTALQKLGPSYRFVTVASTAAPDSHGVVYGPIVLKASGDPYFTDGSVRTLAAGLRAHHVLDIHGRLLVDDTAFDRKRGAPGWKPDFVPDESGPLSASVLDRNGFRSDGAYISNPAAGNGARIIKILKQAGVIVRGGVVVGAASTAGMPVSVRTVSPTLASIARYTLKDSINMNAELVLKAVAAQVTGRGTTVDGAATVRALASAYGVKLGTIVDGSGLSAYDRETAASEVAWLLAARRMPAFSSFYAGLPVGCVDGTLEHRFCGTAAAGRVHAKTGTLDYVRVLAGYTTTRSGRAVTFAFLTYGDTYGPAATAAIDRAVVALSAYTG